MFQSMSVEDVTFIVYTLAYLYFIDTLVPISYGQWPWSVGRSAGLC